MTHRERPDDPSARAQRDLEIRVEAAKVAKLEAEADMVGEARVTEQADRGLRNAIAIAALALMALQVLAANGIFAWYGVAAAWDVPSPPGWGPP